MNPRNTPAEKAYQPQTPQSYKQNPSPSAQPPTQPPTQPPMQQAIQPPTPLMMNGVPMMGQGDMQIAMVPIVMGGIWYWDGVRSRSDGDAADDYEWRAVLPVLWCDVRWVQCNGVSQESWVVPGSNDAADDAARSDVRRERECDYEWRARHAWCAGRAGCAGCAWRAAGNDDEWHAHDDERRAHDELGGQRAWRPRSAWRREPAGAQHACCYD